MSKKVPIHLSKQDLEKIAALGRLFNINAEGYGGIPKIIKQSITFSNLMSETMANLIPAQNEAEIDIITATINKSLKRRLAQEKAQKATENLEKV